LLGSGCSTGAFGFQIGSKGVEIAKFPVNFPVSKGIGGGDGSYLTAHTTIQSHQTADFQADLKQAVSAGIFAGIVPVFRSLVRYPVANGGKPDMVRAAHFGSD
jgi:hypothetical protein